MKGTGFSKESAAHAVVCNFVAEIGRRQIEIPKIGSAMNGKTVIVLGALMFSTAVGAIKWSDGPGGATRQYYNYAARLPWDRELGDWSDANGVLWGEVPFASATLNAHQKMERASWDVSTLVTDWRDKANSNNGFFLRLLEGKGAVKFHSREVYDRRGLTPTLVVDTNGKRISIRAGFDTYLAASTFSSLGKKSTLEVSKDKPALVWFDLSGLDPAVPIRTATLELSIAKVYGNQSLDVGVFRVDPAPSSFAKVPFDSGLASKYELDRNIDKDPDVYFVADFEEDDWIKDWTRSSNKGDVIADEIRGNYQPFLGKALMATIEKGEKMGLNQRYRFRAHGIEEPEEAYFRYYLRLGDNWNQTVSGGKLPGFAGTYGKAGWGGRRPDGSNGWSARGHFSKTIPEHDKNPLGGLNPIGSYIGHMDQEGIYEPAWIWNLGDGAFLKKNKWYSIEQYVKMNTPGEKNGILRAWLDGRLVFEQPDIRFRSVKDLKIEDVWFNLYHGGRIVSPQDQAIYIDNVVVAKRYIGPMKTKIDE